MENMSYQILHGGSLMILFVFVLLFSKIVNDMLTPYKLDEELTAKDNVALAVSVAGYFGAVSAIFIGAYLGPSRGIYQDILSVGGYSLMGIALLNLSHVINDKLILYRFSNVKEIIEDRNAGTGAVQFGSYMASGMIIAGAVHGQGGGPHTALAFYFLGQIALIVFTWLYDRMTPFNIHDEIEKDNVAAGVAFGGAMIAIGIILMKGASGSFVSWSYNLYVFAADSLLIFILLPAIRYFFDKIIIPGSPLNHEIQTDQNMGAALLEITVMISFAVILHFTLG